MSEARHLRHDLQVESHCHRFDRARRASLAEEAVVMAATAPEPPAPLVEGEPRNDDHARPSREVGNREGEPRLGLERAERGAAPAGLGLDADETQSRSIDTRREHLLTAC